MTYEKKGNIANNSEHLYKLTSFSLNKEEYKKKFGKSQGVRYALSSNLSASITKIEWEEILTTLISPIAQSAACNKAGNKSRIR